MSERVQFTSPRLQLVQMDPSEITRFHAVMSNAEAMQTFDLCRPLSSEESADHLNRWIDHQQHHGYSPGLIEVAETGDVLGFGGIAWYPGCESTGPELVYILMPQWWNRGFASEFARAAIAFAFQTLQLPKLFATVLPDNAPSIRILERVGMTRVEYLKETNRHLYAIESVRP